MFKWYKDRKKSEIEAIIKEDIDFNEYKIKKYLTYPNDIDKHISYYDYSINCIAKCSYDYDTAWDYLKRFNVDESLYQRHLHIIRKTLEAEKIYSKKKLEIEEQKKIDVIKKAIIQLKEEGKINV